MKESWLSCNLAILIISNKVSLNEMQSETEKSFPFQMKENLIKREETQSEYNKLESRVITT